MSVLLVAGSKTSMPNRCAPAYALARARFFTTERVRVGSLVFCAPFRHPVLLAKAATSIHLLSGGRFELGVGAGWLAEEFEAFGYGFGTVGERFAVLEDTLH